MVNSPTELIETLKVLNQGGALTGNKIVSLSCSGGEASLVADLSEKTSLRFEPFAEEHFQRINATLTELVTIVIHLIITRLCGATVSQLPTHLPK